MDVISVSVTSESIGASGKDLILAMALGLEISSRIVRAVALSPEEMDNILGKNTQYF